LEIAQKTISDIGVEVRFKKRRGKGRKKEWDEWAINVSENS